MKKEMKKIKEKVASCQKCILYKTRNLPVIGVGNHEAKIIFLGEAPGSQEDKKGEPFVGSAGKILDELLLSIGLKREDVYICNILKCRPPKNRNPLKEEIKNCTPYLLKQIEIINPEVICTLGNFATCFILKEYGLKDEIQGISKIKKKVFKAGSRKIIPLYHPAVATYNRNKIKDLKEDFKILNSL